CMARTIHRSEVTDPDRGWRRGVGLVAQGQRRCRRADHLEEYAARRRAPDLRALRGLVARSRHGLHSGASKPAASSLSVSFSLQVSCWTNSDFEAMSPPWRSSVMPSGTLPALD